MIFGVLDDYIDLHALWQIVVAVLAVAVIVPVAFATAIDGEARRREGGSAGATGTLMLGAGGLVVVAAVIIGLWAMLQK